MLLVLRAEFYGIEHTEVRLKGFTVKHRLKVQELRRVPLEIAGSALTIVDARLSWAVWLN